MKVIFIGGLTNGKLIVEYIINQKNIKIPFIITHPLNFKIHNYENFKKFNKKTKIYRDLNINNFFEKIKKAKPDLIIVAGWSYLISHKIIQIPKLGVIGFHPSLLPKDRGRSVLAWQIEEGYTQTALTMFYISKGIDDGDIIAQNKIKINYKDTIKDILKKCDIETNKLIKKYFDLIIQGKAPRKKQNNNIATYRSLRNNSNSLIDWNTTAKLIYNKVRALTYPYPGSFFYYRKKKIKVIKAAIIKNKIINKLSKNLNNGDIVKKINSKKYKIKCSNGILEIDTKNEIKI